MPVLSRRCRHLLLTLLATAPLLAVRTAHAQLALVENDRRVWGVQFRLTDLDDEPLAPAVPADDRTEDPFADDDLAPIIDIDQPTTFAPAPLAPESLLLDLLDDIPAPAATVVVTALEAPAIEPTQLVRQSRTTTSISGIRRSPVSLQPVIRGYQQQSIFGQYQGAQFIPVRFDLDSILTSIDPGLIENLIIIPGPYGVRYGPGLAFIDVQARPLPRFDVPTLHGRTSVFYQGAGKQFYGHQILRGGGRQYGYRAVYGHKVGDDYTAGSGTLIPSAYNVRDVDFAISRDLNDNSTIQVEYLRQDMTDTRFAGLVFDVDFRRTDALFLRHTVGDGYGGGEWLFQAWWNRTVMAGDNLDTFRRSFYAGSPPFRRYPGYIGFTDADVTSSGCRIGATWGDVNQAQLTAGVDLHFIDQELNELDDFLRPFEDDSLFLLNQPIPRSDMLDVGVFVEATTPIGPDWRITVGGRADWVRTRRSESERLFFILYNIDSPDTSIVRTVTTESFEIENLLLHAYVTAERKLGPGLDLRLGFGHGERPPNLTERFADFPFLNLVQSPTQPTLGYADLVPEAASQFDVALLGDYRDLRFQVLSFWSFIDEHITLSRDLADRGDQDVPVLTFVNADSMLAGAELSVEYDWTPNLTPFANLRYVSGRRLDGGNPSGDPLSEPKEPLPKIYPLESRVGIRWRDPDSNRYGVEFSARIVANQDRVAASVGERPTPGFATFDLRGYWQPNDNLRFTSGFENLTNENYLEHLNVHEPAVLEPGLNFYFTGQWDY